MKKVKIDTTQVLLRVLYTASWIHQKSLPYKLTRGSSVLCSVNTRLAFIDRGQLGRALKTTNVELPSRGVTYHRNSVTLTQSTGKIDT